MDFVTFVNSQDPERVVDHDGGWSSCSVGDYYREVHQSPVHGEMYGTKSGESRAQLLGISLGHFVILANTIGNDDDVVDLRTYGGMARFLNRELSQTENAFVADVLDWSE